MKKNYYQLLHKIRNAFRRGKRNERPERGQVLVIVALSVIGLVAAVGLTVDVGLLYLNHGKLRRAVDAATLAASSQFREGYSTTELEKAAEEFLVLNGVNDPSATVETCTTTPLDPVLCTDPPRKLVRVQATSTMQLAFLPVVGIRTTTVRASAVSEAASMDVVLVIDISESMTKDAEQYTPMRDPAQCNIADSCHPFEEVKDAAIAFVDQLYFPYDRVAIVTFDNNTRTDLAFSGDKNQIKTKINDLKVVDPGDCLGLDGKYIGPTGPCRAYELDAMGNLLDDDGDGFGDLYYGFDCPYYGLHGNPDTCGTTSIGQGLLFAGNEFAKPATFRQESLWVVILLTDGVTNGPSFVCPNTTWPFGFPFCIDHNAETRHCYEADDTSCLAKGGVYDPDKYDADDYARDMADFISEDQEALIFTIGLGEQVKTVEPFDDNGDGAGEQLLKYAADTGGGKYYFAPTGNKLREIFLDIAQNLATRLTQ